MFFLQFCCIQNLNQILNIIPSDLRWAVRSDSYSIWHFRTFVYLDFFLWKSSVLVFYTLLLKFCAMESTDHVEGGAVLCCCRNVHLAVSARWCHAPCSWLETLHCWVVLNLSFGKVLLYKNSHTKSHLLWRISNQGNNQVPRSHTPELQYTQRMLNSMGLKVSDWKRPPSPSC